MDEKIVNALKKLNEKYGAGTVQVASDVAPYGTLEVPFPTVQALSGGIPIGRFTTIAG